jgi:hypothetical protein
LIAWTHGCIGLHFWLRLRRWYPRYAPMLYGVALLLPVSALLGFTQAGREIDYLIARDPNWIAQLYKATNALSPARVRIWWSCATASSMDSRAVLQKHTHREDLRFFALLVETFLKDILGDRYCGKNVRPTGVEE